MKVVDVQTDSLKRSEVPGGRKGGQDGSLVAGGGVRVSSGVGLFMVMREWGVHLIDSGLTV